MDGWTPLINLFQRTSTGIGTLLNTVLIQLIVYRSPKQLGTYKYLMIYISGFELFFGVLELATLPDFYNRDSAWFVIVDPHKSVLPHSLLQFSAVLFCMSFGLSLAVFGVTFGYRYQVLVGKSKWTVNRPRNLLVWMGTPLIFATVWAGVVHFFQNRNEFVDRRLTTEILPSYHVTVDEIGFAGVYFRPVLEDGTQILNWDNVIGWGSMTVLALTSETIMAMFVVKCYSAIGTLISHTSCSSRYQNVQSQLFWALAAQSSIPLLFVQVPACFVFGFTMFEEGSEYVAKMLSISIALYLALDALPTMFIIKSFRRTIFDFFNRLMFWKAASSSRQNEETPVNITLQTIVRG